MSRKIEIYFPQKVGYMDLYYMAKVGDWMDYLEWFPERLAQLRMQKGVSARDMSLSLGQSESYINKIENRRTLPSMAGFLYICEYLEISPQEFFDTSLSAPQKTARLCSALGRLDSRHAEHILQLIDDLTEKK